MAKKRPIFPKERPLRRAVERVKPRAQVYIFCEGKTEAVYLDDFTESIGRESITLSIVGQVGEPKAIVTRAIEEKERLSAIAQKRGASNYDKNYTVWAVFDRDDHDHYNDAIIMAQQNDISVAFSNPCIELWGILHYELCDGEVHRHDAQRKLKSLMPGYDHNDGAEFNFRHMNAKYTAAVLNANRLILNRKNENNDNGNPSTNIHTLTEGLKISAGIPTIRAEKLNELLLELQAVRLSIQREPNNQGLRSQESRLLSLIKTIQ